MAKTILIAGYGPGISNAVAEKFGAEGYQVALMNLLDPKEIAAKFWDLLQARKEWTADFGSWG